VHVVRAGETLYSIAFRHGLTVQALAAWNSLDDPTLIRVGQRLRLSPPAGGVPPASASTPKSGRGPAWGWPASGPILAAFGTGPMTAAGIQLRGAEGDPVQAAGDGQVVYAGNGLPGYGELLIIKHDEQWLSAYGFNAALLVGEGQRVQRGQLIARMGRAPGAAASVGGALHFEVRRGGEPVDPLQVLPARR
jgi:lipoprotein NlpD